jgi:hypothetical protein
MITRDILIDITSNHVLIRRNAFFCPFATSGEICRFWTATVRDDAGLPVLRAMKKPHKARRTAPSRCAGLRGRRKFGVPQDGVRARYGERHLNILKS